ncbi:MAG: hypothetical protein AABZ30_01365 [Myxococcota bacterium]
MIEGSGTGDALDFAAALLAARGALAERSPGGALDYVLPAEATAALGLPEAGRLLDAPADARDGAGVGFGSARLDRLVAEACAAPSAVGLAIDDTPPASAARSARDRVQILNGVIAGASEGPGEAVYAILHFHAVARADEQRETLFSIACGPAGGETPAATTALEQRIDDMRPAPAVVDTVTLAARIARIAARAARERLADFVDGVRRRKARDGGRLREYYGALEVEVRSEIARRRARGSDTTAQQRRLSSLAADLDAKIEALAPRFAVAIELTPVAVAIVRAPSVAIDLRVRRRKAERDVRLHASALTRELDPVGCDACAAGVLAFGLCDDRLHVLCAGCLRAAGGGRRGCHACAP